MADTIKIGNLDISAFKVGGNDCSIYLGDTLLYPYYTPTDKDYLAFIPEEDGTFQFSVNAIDYSLNSGGTWTTLPANTSTPTVRGGNKILWRASGLTPTSGSGIGTFSSSVNFAAEGNIMSLYFGDDFEDKTSLSGKDYAFRSLFGNCAELVSINGLKMPATTLSQYCYRNMFAACSSISSIPNDLLPATTLQEGCYLNMFLGTHIVDLSNFQLPSMSLAKLCYQGMFAQCPNLEKAPVLSAKTLVHSCYIYMLQTNPKLKWIKCLATNISATDCTRGWVSNVASAGTFVKDVTMSDWTVSTSGIPSGWTVTNTSDFKLSSKYSNSSTYQVDCNSSTTLTADEVSGHSTAKSAMTFAYVGSCVDSVGLNAFYGASAMTSVTIHNNVQYLEGQAFFGCSGLTSFTFPSNLKSVGQSCFRYANKIKTLTIPNGVTTLSSGCFADMAALSSATIPSSVTTISTNLFLRDSALNNVHFLGRTAPALGADAFKSSGIQKIYIPDCDCYNSYAATAGMSAYTNYIYAEGASTSCNDLQANYIFRRKLKNGTVYTSGNSASSNVKVGRPAIVTGMTAAQITSTTSGISEVVFGSHCNQIESKAVSGMTQLGNIRTVSTSLTLGTSAFSDCGNAVSTGLTITIGNGVTSIPNYCFQTARCIRIDIPSTVTSIGTYVFTNCITSNASSSNKLKVICRAASPPSTTITTFPSTTSTAYVGKWNIYVPDASVNSYKSAGNWSDWASVILPLSQL